MKKIVLVFFFLVLGLVSVLRAQAISIQQYQGDTVPCSGTPIRFCAGGLMEGGSDKCVWKWSDDNGGAVSIVNLDKTKKNDSIQLALYTNAVSGILTLTYGSNPPIEKRIVVAQPVNTRETIHADTIFCQGNTHKFSIDPDPRNIPTAPNYYGKPVQYTWKFYDKDGLFQFESKGSKAEAELGVTPIFSDGKVTLIKETCPPTQVHTVKDVIAPFIASPPINPNAEIKKIGYYKPLAEDNYKWVPETDLFACTYYSSAFNAAYVGNTVGKWGNGDGKGYGDGYLYLEIGDNNITGLTYNWTFDTTQFAMAEPAVYNHQDLINNGFAPNNYRVCLKVLNPAPATDDYLNISVIASCPACNKMSGTSNYTTKKYEISVKRQDSLKPYKDFKILADPTNMPPCSGTEVSFKTVDKESRPMSILTSNYGVTSFRYAPGTGGTRATTPPTEGYDINLVIKARTPGINDTLPLTVYPANACFKNKVDSNKQVIKVPVIATPKIPLFYDGEDTRIVNTTFSKQTGQWASQNPYLVCNGTLSDYGSERCLVKSSTQTDPIRDGVGFYRPDFMETAEINTRMRDSVTWEVDIKLDAAKPPQTNSYDKLGIYAKNKCGNGDTAYFWVYVIDTIPVYAPILNDLNGSALSDTICEGTLLLLTSSQQDYTNPVDPYKPLTNPALNPKPTNEWKLPPSWTYQSGSDSSQVPVGIVVGEGTGHIRLRYGNKCGWSTYAETQIIEPRRFTRVRIASNSTPCQGDRITYTIDSVRDADRYIWQFPSDWVTLNGTNIDTSFNHEAVRDTVRDAWSGDIISITGTMSMPVVAGGKAGHIYVIGENDICDFTFANPPHKDSLKVIPRAWTKAPKSISGFFDTLCARDTAHFEIAAHADDTAKAVYYTWHFSNPDWGIYQKSSDSAKKFSVLIPDIANRKDSILIIGHRHDCDQTNKGDTLVYRFHIKDTVSMGGGIRNHNSNTLNTSPCEGDTVFYVVDKSLMDASVRSIHWAWSAGFVTDTVRDTISIPTGDSIVIKAIKIGLNGWERLKPNDYGDTLVLKVGGDTLAVYASTVNCCGMSKPIMDSIRPVNLVVQIPKIIAPNIICTQENLTYSLHSEIKHATNYTWHFPWGETIDSLPPASGLPTIYLQKNAYDTGFVKVTPSNSCGFGTSDSVHISLVNYPPSRPLPANFASTFNPEIDTMALFGPVCLRQENILKLKRNPNKDSVLLEYSWEILFDIDNSMDCQTEDGVADFSDSTYRITKNAGLDTSLLLFSSRVKGCQTYGDSLFVQVRGRDTTALPHNKHSLDYIKDALTPSRLIELLPCASEESFAKYYFDNRIDTTITSYKFRFGKTLTGIAPIIPDSIAVDGTFNGTNWEIVDKNLLQDSLHVKVGTDTIYLQIETTNICGTSKLPALYIKTIGVAPEKISFTQIDSSICFKERTDTFSVTYNESISSYIWHSPWRPVDFSGAEPLPGESYIDTTHTYIHKFEVDSVLGNIYVEPRNGCINKQPNPSILYSDTIKVDHILRPPKRVHPLNFASTYDPSGNLPAIDTLCLRAYPEYIVSHHSKDTLPLEYKWEIVKQSYTTIDPLDSICHVKKTEGADTTFLMVFAKLSVCEKYGDTLHIELRTMDTVAMPLPLEEYIFDKKTGNTKIDLVPCGFQEVAYYIDRSFHWSIDSARFRWNGGTVINAVDSTLGNTDWKILNALGLPDTLYAQTGNSKKLLLQPQVHNLCGWSQPTPLEISPLSLIEFKPKIHIDSILCNRDTIEVSVDSVPYATHYIWHFPWKPKAYTGPTLQGGESYTDTVTSHRRTFSEVYEIGKIWVSPINKCSRGEDSDTVDIEDIIHPPHSLVPNSLWLNNATYINDTVFDTICRYAVPDYMLRVSPNQSDSRDSLIYHWSVLAGSLKIMPDNDTVITVKNVDFVPELNHLVVATRWSICKTYSDSLHVKLYVVDTVARADMGEIMPINPAGSFNFNPCPGAEMIIGLEHPLVSPAYKWSFTDNSWHFKEGTDSTAAQVTIIAGATPTSISVTPITDGSRSICTYFSNNPLTISTPFIPVPPLLTDIWRDVPNQLPCVGKYQTYKVSPTNGADSYRWEFPLGWIVEGTQDSVLKEGVDTCRVLVGRTAGLVSVYAIDTCDPNIPLTILGIPTTSTVTPVDSARVLFIGDRQPCIDSLSNYLVQKNESTERFDFEFIPEPANVIHAEVYEWNNDTTELQVRWTQIKAATFIFKPTPNALGGCNNFVNDTIYIKADTVPYISGKISGEDFICMNDVYEYKAHADMDTANGQYTVSYTWVLPNDTWKFLSDPDSSWVRVVSGIYMNSIEDTIKCYPRAGCGTGNPFTFAVSLNIPDTLQNSILVDNNDTNPCVGTQINLHLAHNNYDFDTISFYWYAPPSWQELAPDSARTSTTFKVGIQSDTIWLRALRDNSCGLSAPLGIYINSKEKPKGAEFTKVPYPCINQEQVGLSIKSDFNMDSLSWVFPNAVEYRLFANRIKYDSVLISEVGETPISLLLTGFNKCGSTDTTIEIHPVTAIQKFKSDIRLPHAVCVNDTGYAEIEIPLDHLEKGTEYKWFTPLEWTYLFDSIVLSSRNPDTICSRVWFKTNDAHGNKISVYAHNACGEIPEKEKTVDLYRINVTASAEPTVVPFLQSGVILEVTEITPPDISSYTYEWSPRNRVYKIEDDLGNSFWETGELVDPVEYFVVKAIDKVTGFKCVGYDTVAVNVTGSFEVNFETRPFICRADSVYLYANPQGGDMARYSFRWSSKIQEEDAYQDLERASAFLENPIIYPSADTLYFRLIACDTVEIDNTELDPNTGVPTTLQFIRCDTQYLSIEVKDLNVLITDPYDDKIEINVGDSRTFEGLITEGTGEYVHIWYPAELFVGEDSLKLRTQSQCFYEDYIIRFAVTDTLTGCMAIDTVQVDLTGVFGNIPNAFSPNGDGKNDIFMKDIDLIILNRLGMEIFRSKNKEGWDGTYKGKRVDKDDYLYIITVTTKKKQYIKKGTVTVF